MSHDRAARTVCGMDHEQMEVGPSLAVWGGQMAALPDAVENVYAFFNNDYSGYSVATCNRFKELMGLPVHQPRWEKHRGRCFN